MVDGYNTTVGSFCLKVTNLTNVGVINVNQTNIKVSPNPTTDIVNFDNVTIEHIELLDNTGRVVMSQNEPGCTIDMKELPAGVYFYRLNADGDVITGRVVKQ